MGALNPINCWDEDDTSWRCLHGVFTHIRRGETETEGEMSQRGTSPNHSLLTHIMKTINHHQFQKSLVDFVSDSFEKITQVWFLESF